MRFAVSVLVMFAATLALAAEETLPTLPKLESGQYGYQEVVTVEGVESPELLSRARAWVAKTYESANAVIQLDDPAGTLVVKGIFTVKAYLGGASINHVITIEAKSGRYRCTLSDYVYAEHWPVETWHPGEPFGTAAGTEKMRGRVAAASQAIIASLKAAMLAPTPAKSNW